MAKVVEDKQKIVTPQWWSGTEGALVGLGVGLSWWLLVIIFLNYVLETPGIASGVAHVLVGVGAILTLIRYRVPRPILIVLASAVALWPLGALIEGLVWWEAALWSVGLFGLSYGLFSMVATIRHLWLSLVVATVIALLAMIVLAL